MGISIKKLLNGMLKVGASDLHLKVGQQPVIRLNGMLRTVDEEPLTDKDTKRINDEIMPERCRSTFEKRGSVDYSYSMSTMKRFRINAYHQRGAVSIAVRPIVAKSLTIDELNLPGAVQTFASYPRGLILVTGISGSGKSSTLAALISLINATRRDHIITLEDPIEFLYEDDKCIVDQIEIGADVSDFKLAIRSVLRQDPDVILIGELRDRETVQTAMHCVETGHLVLSTLHTPDAKQTVLRLLRFFPPEDHQLISEQLAMNLRAVVCQRLMRRADGKGRVPVCEIMIGTPIIQKLIRENRHEDIGLVLKNGEDGMQSFDSHLLYLVKRGTISEDDALLVAHDPAAFKRALKGRVSGSDKKAIIQ